MLFFLTKKLAYFKNTENTFFYEFFLLGEETYENNLK